MNKNVQVSLRVWPATFPGSGTAVRPVDPLGRDFKGIIHNAHF
jgi:hypothetical protein